MRPPRLAAERSFEVALPRRISKIDAKSWSPEFSAIRQSLLESLGKRLRAGTWSSALAAVIVVTCTPWLVQPTNPVT